MFEDDRISSEMIAVYRNKTAAERLQVGFDMWRAAQKLVTAGVRHQHPDWAEEQVRTEVARRMSHGLG